MKDKELEKALEKYPELVSSIVKFVTEPACVRLLEAGGKYRGSITLNVVEGQVVSMIPSLELKAGFEIKK